MRIVDRRLGNVSSDIGLEGYVDSLEEKGQVERVKITHRDAQKRRLRVEAESGEDVGIALEEDFHLENGDVLCLGDDDSNVVVVEVSASEAMVIKVNSILRDRESFAYGVALGHMLGNQHWPIKVDGFTVLTPVNVDRLVMETVLRTHGFEGLEWEFKNVEPGEVPDAIPRIELNHEH